MKTVKKDDGWWITEMPEGDDCGPYDTKAEALDNLRGLRRFYKEWAKECAEVHALEDGSTH